MIYNHFYLEKETYMLLQNLRYFKRVAELNSVSQTAKEFQVVQSAVSSQIKSLEMELGTPLFKRQSNKIFLNEKGKAAYSYSCEILGLMKDLKQEMADRTNQSTADLTLSVETLPIALPYLIQDFKSKHPEIRIHLIQYQKNFYFEDLGCDLLIYASDYPLKEENAVTIYKEDIYLAVSKAHPFASRKSISLSELDNQSFIQRTEASGFRRITDKFFNSGVFQPSSYIYCDYPPFINELVASNMGIAFIPKLTWLFYRNPDIVLLNIENNDISHYINLTWRRRSYVSHAMKQFRENAESFFKNLPMTQADIQKGKITWNGPN